MRDTHNSGEGWILETLYNANRTDVETYRVFETMRRYIYDTRDFFGVIDIINPGVVRFKPATDVADDCFFSVSLFSKAIRTRKKRYGSPGVRFYSKAGKNAFSQIGYSCVANNWEFWVSYVREHFNVDSNY